MKSTLLVLTAAFTLAIAATASASTVTIGQALPLSGTAVNEVPCPSFGPDCWWANIQLPPGGIVEAPQTGTITSWKAEGLAGKAEPLVLKQTSGTDTFTIVSEGSEVSEPCGGTGAQCDGGTAVTRSAPICRS